MMKTLSMFTLLAALCVAAASPVQAQEISVLDKTLLTLNVGPTFGTLQTTDTKAEGATFNFTIEKFFTEHLSLGFNMAYIAGFSEVVVGDVALPPTDTTVTDYWSLPSSITLRATIGTQSIIRPYVSLGLGIFYSESTEEVLGSSQHEWGFTASAPIGFWAFLNPKVYLNFNWTPAISTNSLFKDDFVHVVNVGVGFVL